MSKVFLSYRHEDSAYVIDRIDERLVQEFGRQAVFLDVDSIPFGVDFRKRLDEQVAKCEVFLAVIGPDWIGPRDSQGKTRLEDPRDFVRIEIESALTRQIPVIPILVRGASVPSSEQLPQSLQELPYQQGLSVRSGPDFHNDMSRLIEQLRVQIKEKREHSPVPDAYHKTSDVSARTTETRFEVEPPGQERIDAVVPPFKADAPDRLVEPIEEEPATSTPPARATTNQSQSYMFGVIGLLVLIVGLAAFLILQPTPRSTVPTPAMIQLSSGSFMMGGSERDDTPIHRVQFTKPFAIARHETTFHQYDRFAQATGRQLPKDNDWGRGQRPVINVSWEDANAYAHWLSGQTGKRYRLPTEAEWEYAARSGGKNEIWTRESQLREHAVYDTNRTESVGSKRPNDLGLYDMNGNVWEWVEDCWHENYKGAPPDGSAWLAPNLSNCSLRVVRGEAWNSFPAYLLVSTRTWGSTDKGLNSEYRCILGASDRFSLLSYRTD